jgi:hypothetical protein
MLGYNLPGLLGLSQVRPQPVQHIIGRRTVGHIQWVVGINHRDMHVPIIKRIVALRIAPTQHIRRQIKHIQVWPHANVVLVVPQRRIQPGLVEHIPVNLKHFRVIF